MPVTVTLAGPAPWGFRITGGRDFRKPITVSKVTEHGKAAAGDLRPGDIIIAINGESAAEMLNVEAQNKIKQSPGQLRLQVERSPMPPSSHANGDTSPERLATRFQVSPGQPLPTPAPHPGLISAAGISLPSPGHAADAGGEPGRPESLLLQPSIPQPPTRQRQVRPDPAAPKPSPFAAPNLYPLQPHTFTLCSPKPSPFALPNIAPCSPIASPLAAPLPRYRPALLRLGDRVCRAAAGPATPFPSRLSPSVRKPVAGVQKLHVCEKCSSTIATQAVRIQDGRYRHPSCYACADCGLNLKMRGHFWVGDELYCEKHARLRYQGSPGGSAAPPVSPHS
ncbi:PDLI3 protein, partial [Pelecanoides urinatrix]|nr:PDLI3 protein [Pelecanoides urinatrix]